MKALLTTLLLFLISSVHAQRIRFSPRENRHPDFASYNIIGQINGRYLIFIQGPTSKEIGVYDEDMNKIKSVPADFIKPGILQANYFAYPDHVELYYQYGIDTTFFVSRLRIDGEGKVIEGPTIMDSIVLPQKKILVGGRLIDRINSFRPMFLVQRSENKQWIMIIKGGGSADTARQLSTTLYDKDLRPVEHGQFTYSSEQDPGEFSEFIVDNVGNLAFVHSTVEDEDAKKILQATLFFKPHGSDTLISADLTLPDVILDHLDLQVDNVNRRYILNSLYYKWRDPNISGLCSIVWDDSSRSVISKTLTPVPATTMAEARSDFSPPEQVLNNYYLRQVFPFSNGSFLVLAELCHGTDKLDPYGRNRYDFIHGKSPSVLTPAYLAIRYEPHEKPGVWAEQGKERIADPFDRTRDKKTDNLLLFSMDRNGRAQDIKVIHKAQNTAPWLQTTSYQAFLEEQAIHLLYNEEVKGSIVPMVISIKTDGTFVSEPPLHSLGRDQILFPRYGKQVGPKTAIIPCQDGVHLCFARVDFE